MTCAFCNVDVPAVSGSAAGIAKRARLTQWQPAGTAVELGRTRTVDPAPSPAVTSNIVNGASAKLDALFWPVAAASSVANASWSNLQAVWTGHAQRPCTCTTAVHTVEHI